jgi:hypothetical protein
MSDANKGVQVKKVTFYHQAAAVALLSGLALSGVANAEADGERK